jgi:hypothetical protein
MCLSLKVSQANTILSSLYFLLASNCDVAALTERARLQSFAISCAHRQPYSHIRSSASAQPPRRYPHSEGSFAVVRYAVHLPTGVDVAIKVFDKTKIEDEYVM